ncbi:hypothetical protein [Larkinella rosea]|uniref:Uncharacterized protein n=1 Tax=Larkinella rosea TaxID=2025312 RepID=A0A3P1B9J5_9BACT|nr:hypothetical protein [Larkinella rosea]RRA97718.1 hypothetical protein EHT25_32250 [Larkinella rosea]
MTTPVSNTLKKSIRSLFILFVIIASLIVASPANMRGILIAVGSFEFVGMSVMSWMAASARWVFRDSAYPTH